MGKPLSFGGYQIFGRGGSSQTAAFEHELQINEYFGLHGVEILDGGSRGGETTVSGVVFGASYAAYLAAWGAAASLADGIPRTLITTDGEWGAVLMEVWRPSGRQLRDETGAVYQPYQARFRHAI